MASVSTSQVKRDLVERDLPPSPRLRGTGRARFRLRPRRWLLPAVLLALTPKCLLCLAGYLGLGIALGLPVGNRELCGGGSVFSLPSSTQLYAHVQTTVGRIVRSLQAPEAPNILSPAIPTEKKP